MGLTLHNSLTRTKAPFVPLNAGRAAIYICGPTVYSSAHIGNFRTFLLGDILRRFLVWSGLEVTYVSNITDVGHLTQDDIEAGEDKMQAAAEREGVTIWDIAGKYTAAYHEDCRHLNILPPDVEPKATEHIDDMITMISTLIDKGHAYVVDGEVYYDISSFPAYGQLSGNRLEDLKAGARVDVLDVKRHPGDFALWKKDDAHLMQWDSPWGRGFPGWHIECSAMSMKYLGTTFDIHLGGEDLAFPHHECEIAQSEGATGDPFARCWVHGSYLLVDGKKMSKSRGTLWTVGDLLERGYTSREIRWLLTSAHYRQNLNFTLEGLDGARTALRRIDDLVGRCRRAKASGDAAQLPGLLDSLTARFRAALEDDLNVSGAWGALFESVTALNKLELSSDDGRRIIGTLESLDQVLGVLFHEPPADAALSGEDQILLQERQQAKAGKNWARADEIRDLFAARGLVLEDTADGTVVKPK